MFNKLKDLIFGLGEFEKTKIEIRFDLALSLIDNLNLKKLEDLEIIEECLYKIKDLLRLKSSNLNKTINNPSILLKKKDVLNIIDKLNKIKYDFLNGAFEELNTNKFNENDLKQENKVDVDNNIVDVEVLENSKNDNLNSKKQNLLNKLDTLFEKKSEINTNIKSKNVSNKVFENEDLIIYFESSKIIYFFIKFKKEVNLIVLKDLSSILFDLIKAHGTNIIIEKDYVLILPRFNQDNLFELPKVQSSLDDVFNELKNDNKIGEKTVNVNPMITQNSKKQENERDYIQITNEKFSDKKSLKKKEDSLDNLLEKQLHDVEHTIKEKVDSDAKLEFEKNDDKVILELDEKNFANNPNIEIEKNDDKDKVDFSKYLIYSDENIEVFLDENSKVLGQINIKSKKSDSFSSLNENDLSYLFIFSKIFSSILFDTIKIEGTNLIYDSNSNILKIIPRFNEDKLLNLTWKSLSHSDDFLEQLRNKLLLNMQDAIKDNDVDLDKKKENKDLKKEEKIEKKLVNSSSSLKEKADYILDSLRRIP